MPDLLILDCDGWWRRLAHMSAMYAQEYDSCNSDHFVADVAGECINLIRDRRLAEQQLRSWCVDIGAGLGYAGADILPPTMAPLIHEFGTDLLRQLDQACAYLPDGVLPYHFHCLRDIRQQTTVYLARTDELPR